MWQWVARGNIQQISYIPQTEQHLPLGLMVLHLGNATDFVYRVKEIVTPSQVWMIINIGAGLNYSCLRDVYSDRLQL